MKYRIIKKQHRIDDTAEVGTSYYIQFFKEGRFWKRWKYYEVLRCYGMDYQYERISFDKLEEAISYLNNLGTKLEEEIIPYN